MKNSNRLYSFLLKLLSIVESVTLPLIKTFLNTTVGQGFLSKVFGWIVDKAWDEVAEPFFKIIIVRVGYAYDVKQGKILITKLSEAEANNDQDTYDSTVDDIFS